jgi:predicted Zn-dependent peptidase
LKGNPEGRTTQQINEEFTRLGAELNAYTSYDHTIFYAKVPSRHLRTAAEMWKELLIKKTVNEIEFNAEKKVVLQEIQLYADIPEVDVNYSVRKKHFVNTPLEHNILGTLESVSNITPDMMSEYINKLYSLDNAVVTLVGGGFNFDAEKEYLTYLFNESIPHPQPHPIYPPKVTLPSAKSQIKYYHSGVAKPLSYVALCWDSPGISSIDFFPLLLLNTYIGNSRTSLLYKEVISKGIASACRYGFEAFYDVSAASIVYVTTPNKTDEVFKKIMSLLIELNDLKITDSIVNSLFEEIWGSYLVEIEDPTNYGIDLLSKYLKFRQPLLLDDFYEKIQVSSTEVQQAKEKLFETLNLTVFSSGTVPSEWVPDFPKNSPW